MWNGIYIMLKIVKVLVTTILLFHLYCSMFYKKKKQQNSTFTEGEDDLLLCNW